ncbi:MAG: histidine phosphatase family protein [Chlamydiales bacterium]|nr:histidine phosphatase family protein [Chlamydiales bacterium]
MPFYKKDFYFVRHGQTAYNAEDVQADHPPHLTLTDLGKEQARRIQPIITSLPIKAICVSPFERAKETNRIISSNLTAAQYEIDHLGECSYLVWQELLELDTKPLDQISDETKRFIRQVEIGINKSLSFPSPVLIVSHGGVYYAMCYLMNINEGRVIDNCTPIHVTYQNNIWTTTKLISSP